MERQIHMQSCYHNTTLIHLTTSVRLGANRVVRLGKAFPYGQELHDAALAGFVQIVSD